MRKSTFILGLILIAFFCSCGNNDKRLVNETEEINTQKKWIHFPFVKVDTFWFDEDVFHMNLIDSLPFLNNVYQSQYGTMHLLQAEVYNYKFENIKLNIYMPYREDGSHINYEISKLEYEMMLQSFSNEDFRDFTFEYLTINNQTISNYISNSTCLLDRVNMIFAREIDNEFPEKFPHNSTWFGYNSFEIFRMYFEECANGQEGIGHYLVNSIEGRTNYLKEQDIQQLNDLIEKYQVIFESDK